MLIVTAAQMRALDREVIERIGVPGVALMESAGRAVVEVLAALRAPRGTRYVVFAGPGNNGGDGYVVARHLYDRGAEVQVIRCVPEARVSGDARVHYGACQRTGVEVLDGTAPPSLADAVRATAEADVVVDALLGTGLTRNVDGLLAEAIAAINRHRGVVVAVDIPSGLDADRGVPLGICVRAHHTVTLGLPKVGLCSAPGFTQVGRLHVADIGIPERLARAAGISAELLGDEVLAPVHAAPDPMAHKGARGHVLVLGGSAGKTGAALLCGSAALHAGAGLVTLAVPRAIQASIDGRIPELMTAAYGSVGGAPVDLTAAPAVIGEIASLLPGKRVLAVGPGMPTDPAFAEILTHLCAQAIGHGLAVVIDADGLNHLARDPRILEGRKEAGRVVLTPHPGEAARLLGASTADVQADRTAVARHLAARFSAVVALKGARTVVARSDGRIAISPTGNPGLGTGGTGDVLTGCVAGLLGRERDPFDACTQAVYAHGAAGDRLLVAEGLGFTASQVVDALSQILTPRCQ
jgi:NAD(P)H-hydrate epimerase